MQIKNDLGRCRALPVAYNGLYSRVCENTLDGLVCHVFAELACAYMHALFLMLLQIGYWLSIGCCMLFTIIAVVLGLVLYDYFSRAGTRVVKCTDTTATSSENASLIPHDNDDVYVIQYPIAICGV